MWKSSAPSTKKKYFPRAMIAVKPSCENVRATSANTPIGAANNRSITSFMMISLRSCAIANTRLPGAPAMQVAMPKRIENTITWSMLPSAIDLNGLLGKISRITSVSGGLAATVKSLS